MDELAGLEQLEKRVEWLDNERRNDKTNLASLQNRLTTLESDNMTLRKQIKDQDVVISKLTSQVSGLDKYDNRIDRLNIDLTKQIREVNERADQNLGESVKRLKLDVEAIKKSVADIFPFTEQFDPIRNELKAYKLEDSRLARLIEELKVKIQDVGRFDEDYRRSLHLLEENRRQEAKRLTDLQGEVAAVRKRVEETRNRFDSFTDSFRTLDMRIAELQTYERDRKEAQLEFTEKVNNALMDKEKTFKTWEKRFDDIQKVNVDLSTQMQDLEQIRQSVSKSLGGVDEVTQKFERRINEISEVQRLNDERFRQEWTVFKADDLKRWTNYMLSQEELARDSHQEMSAAKQQLEALNDVTLRTRDELERLRRETVKHVQSILVAYQESIQSIAPLLDKKA
ncbi:MAG: hypothetical protein VB029_05210 [Anaerolineaceae bacterium]|jgi:chromosome segregation ATPase|nr:hypothetical protein [Anaerolineaceae bacterium]HNX46243.1 hypothetical protein [Anaerolineaceae bacterium]HPT23600.1 hypothetical protein [Anaerolineaceae bacterium]